MKPKPFPTFPNLSLEFSEETMNRESVYFCNNDTTQVLENGMTKRNKFAKISKSGKSSISIYVW